MPPLGLVPGDSNTDTGPELVVPEGTSLRQWGCYPGMFVGIWPYERVFSVLIHDLVTIPVKRGSLFPIARCAPLNQLASHNAYVATRWLWYILTEMVELNFSVNSRFSEVFCWWWKVSITFEWEIYLFKNEGFLQALYVHFAKCNFYEQEFIFVLISEYKSFIQNNLDMVF